MPKTTDAHPNIILIMLDQMRYDCAGFMGHHEARTPAMDRLAREGVVFDNAYCAAPQCSPARASWVTGLYRWVLDRNPQEQQELT